MGPTFWAIWALGALFAVLNLSSAFAQQGSGPDNGGITRGNFLRIPDYRTPGTGAQSYFVNASTGNDSFNCQSASTPCLTIQGAVNKVPKLLRDQVTVNVAAGIYAGFIVSGFSEDVGVQQSTGGLLIDGALANSTLATGSATGTAAGAGQVAGSGSTFGVLCDSGATWTVNDLRGRFITTASPTNSAFVVSSNTATCVTIVGTWSLPVAGVTTYTIQDPSVITNTAISLPATPVSAATANSAGIGIFGNSITYRNSAIVLRNIKVANAVGNGVLVQDTSSVLLTQMQIVPSASNPTALFVNTNTPNGGAGGPLVTATKVYIAKSNDNSAISFTTGALSVSNSLVFNTNSAGDVPAIFGRGGRLSFFSASEVNGWTIGIGIENGNAGAPSTSPFMAGSRLICRVHAGSVGLWLGYSTSTSALAGFATIGISTTDISSCEVGVQTVGTASIDVTSLSGSVSVTGFAGYLGSTFVYTKAGITLTAGTNEINLDSGGLTANFADVTAGSCVASAPQSSRVCGR